MNALHLAAPIGHLYFVKYLADKISIDAVTNDGKNALHISANKGQTEVVRYLVSIKSPNDSVTKNGNNALHLAAGKL